MPNRYRAVSFDAGFTLIHEVADVPQIVTQVLIDAGFVADPAALAHAFSRAERLFLEDYLRPLNATWESDAGIIRFYQGYYAQLLSLIGVHDRDHARHADQIIERYLQPANWQVFPGVPAALAAMRADGLQLGVASDWGSNLLRILRHHELTRYFDWVVVSGAVGAAKPSPRFFGQVITRSGLDASAIVHVGDSYYADVRGARTVGMDAVLIDWRKRSLPPLDVPVIHDLEALQHLL